MSNQWHQFLHPVGTATDHTLRLDLSGHRFPYMFNGKTIHIEAMHLFLKLEDGFAFDSASLAFDLEREGGPAFSGNWQTSGSLAGTLPYANPFAGQSHETGTWLLAVSENALANLPAALRRTVEVDGVSHPRLNPEAFDDVVLVCQYSVS